MTRLRLSVTALVVWLLVELALVGLRPELQLTSLASVWVALAGVAMLTWSRLQRLNVGLVLALFVGLLLALKWVAPTPLAGAALPVTLLEVGALVVTVLLARQVGLAMHLLEESMLNAIVGQVAERRGRQGEMYREVRRARMHERPLAMLALRCDGDGVNAATEQILQSARQSIAERYLRTRLAEVMRDTLDDTSILGWHNDHFVVLLPETAPETVQSVAQRLRWLGRERLGVPIQIGTACLPSDAKTFDGLAHRATENMQTDGVAGEQPSEPALSHPVDGAPIAERPYANVDTH